MFGFVLAWQIFFQLVFLILASKFHVFGVVQVLFYAYMLVCVWGCLVFCNVSHCGNYVVGLVVRAQGC